jgi:hypothetical protein
MCLKYNIISFQVPKYRLQKKKILVLTPATEANREQESNIIYYRSGLFA